LSFLGTAQSNKQYTKVKVSYGVETFIDKSKKSYKFLLANAPNLAQKLESISSEFEFTLLLNDSVSTFYLEKKVFSDNNAAKMSLGYSKYFGRIRQQSNNFITEALDEDFGEFLVARPYLKWELHDETKVIGDFTCFKATTFYTVTNPDGKVFNHDFTAWYTPQLPYKFGPAGFGNLPGLIIELQDKNAIYGVDKIKFFEEGMQSKENEMPQLKRKKLITEEEFECLAAVDEKRWREKND
jgi:GLPGLI family protein